MPKKAAQVSPEQGGLLVVDPYSQQITPNPAVLPDAPPLFSEPVKPLNYDQAKHDPNPGLTSSLAEGWGVLHYVILKIARERSNGGFVSLPEGVPPVKRFAEQIGGTNFEAQEVVAGALGKRKQEAQLRLNSYWDKQAKRARHYNSYKKIVPDEVITEFLPMDISTVEHRFFAAMTPEEAKAKEKKRQVISAFVKKHKL